MRAKSAVELVQELTNDEWRQIVSSRLASHLGDEIWNEVDRTWRTRHCKQLAKAARLLEAAEPRLASFDTVMGRQMVKDKVSHSPVAVAMVDHVVSAQTHIGTLVLALRVTGIVLCELHGRLSDCHCLKDLADKTALPLLRAKITQICDEYLTSIT